MWKEKHERAGGGGVNYVLYGIVVCIVVLHNCFLSFSVSSLTKMHSEDVVFITWYAYICSCIIVVLFLGFSLIIYFTEGNESGIIEEGEGNVDSSIKILPLITFFSSLNGFIPHSKPVHKAFEETEGRRVSETAWWDSRLRKNMLAVVIAWSVYRNISRLARNVISSFAGSLKRKWKSRSFYLLGALKHKGRAIQMASRTYYALSEGWGGVRREKDVLSNHTMKS